MITGKPISTISYNTENYLVQILQSLVKRRIVQFRLYVVHKAEDDELRDHIHVYLEPCKRLDTEELRDEFKEKDLSGASDKPLGVQPFHNSSSFLDMFLYFKHDLRYLASMKQERKYHYLDIDIKCSDREYLQERLRTAPLPRSMKNTEILSDLTRGERPTNVLLKNNVPIEKWSSYVKAFQLFYTDVLGVTRDQFGTTTDKGVPAKKSD